MSSDTDAGSIVAAAAESAIANYCGMAGIVFLLYEYTITFGMEVDLFWTRRFSGATVLFLANKYITLLNHLFDLSLFIPIHVSDKTCDLHAKAFSSLDYLQYVPWAVFSGLRAFALSRNWILSLSISLLSLVPLGANFSVNIYGVNDPVAGSCGMGEIITPALQFKLVIVARTCLIAADVLLIFLTWYYLPRRGITRTIGRGARSFVDVLLLDGTIYFSVLLILNTLHMFLTLFSTSELTYFTEPVTAVLISRFLLHLQKMNQDQRSVNLNADASDREHESNISTKFADRSVVFARVIGSIGTTHLANLSTTSSTRSFEGSIEMEALGRVPARGDP